jgi:hypothetical protein
MRCKLWKRYPQGKEEETSRATQLGKSCAAVFKTWFPENAYPGVITRSPLTLAKCRWLNVATSLSCSKAVAATMRS